MKKEVDKRLRAEFNREIDIDADNVMNEIQPMLTEQLESYLQKAKRYMDFNLSRSKETNSTANTISE